MMKPCNCTPPVIDPQFRACIETGGIGIYSPGRTVEDAIQNVKRHAKKDRIPRREWVACWVEDMDSGREIFVDGFTTNF